MYERMLDRQTKPQIKDMTAYCSVCGELFASLNRWLSETYDTVQEISFPYGNRYGWCVSHRKSKKLVCHVFAENGSLTVMMRLSDQQFASVYAQVKKYTQEYIDSQYPCGNGGWIHYRITEKDHFLDAQTLLTAKCSQ